MNKSNVFCVLGLIALSVSVASGATISFEYSSSQGTSGVTFPSFPGITTGDLADGITVDYSLDGGAAATTSTLTDNAYSTTAPRSGNGTQIDRYLLDLGSVQGVSTFRAYSYNSGDSRWLQEYTLYGTTVDSSTLTDAFDENDAAWVEIGFLDSLALDPSIPTTDTARTTAGLTDRVGVSSISGIDANYREFLVVAAMPRAAGDFPSEHTNYAQFDVIAIPEPSSLALMGIALAGLLVWRRRKV